MLVYQRVPTGKSSKKMMLFHMVFPLTAAEFFSGHLVGILQTAWHAMRRMPCGFGRGELAWNPGTKKLLKMLGK
jgi:hypothetical protein